MEAKKVVKISVNIDKEIHKKLKIFALELEIPFSKFINDVFEKFLKNIEGKPVENS
jgi:hypothetical protein